MHVRACGCCFNVNFSMILMKMPIGKIVEIITGQRKTKKPKKKIKGAA